METLGNPGIGFIYNDQGLNLQCFQFKLILNKSNLLFTKKVTDVFKLQILPKMKKELAAMAISVHFQCQGLAIPTFDTKTEEDSGLRFDNHQDA